ncbi:unnamed protein product, partial [Closterium sp. NIES-54]
ATHPSDVAALQRFHSLVYTIASSSRANSTRGNSSSSGNSKNSRNGSRVIAGREGKKVPGVPGWFPSTNSDPCQDSFPGLQCSNDQPPRVTGLGLYSQGLHGSSLRAIALLTRLEFIDLESNAFHCCLPKTFSRLLHLTYLDVSKNLLYGPLPDFSHLPLEFLFLDRNRPAPAPAPSPAPASLSPPSCAPTSAPAPAAAPATASPSASAPAAAFASGPILSGGLTFRAPRAQRWCGLTGGIPAGLANVTTLHTLDLSFNSLSGAIPAALTARLTRLLHLGLQSNQLSGAIPPLHQLKQLATLQLAFNPFTPAPLPPSIPRLTSLVLVLDLSATNLRGPLPDLSALVGVSDLLLDFNGLDGPLDPKYLPSGRLGFFSAHSNNFSGPIDPRLAIPLASPIFSILDSGLILANNSFSGSLPGSLGRLVQSYVVDVSHNHLSGRIPPSFGTLYQLTRFLLNDNAITGTIPRELSIATGLRVLRLAGNRLTGTIPATFTALTRLQAPSRLKIALCPSAPNQELDLSRNYLVASLPDLFSSLHRLTLLNTSRNFLSGPLPSHLPASLLSLDLSNNVFSGRLPGSSDWLPENATARLHGNCLQLPSCPVPPNLRSSFGAKLRDSFGPNLRAGSVCWLARQRSERQCASFCGANESVTRVCR